MKSKPTIAIAGFQHETNTFAPHKAHYTDFVKADGWPGLTQSDAIFDVFETLNIPISGFFNSAIQQHWNIEPILWASAEPSSYVTEHAFETIAAMICDAIANWDNLDGVYLDLHGAMVAEHLQDGEGELLKRIRSIIGAEMPLIISLDLHANVTNLMLEHATAMTIFRTYPHLDMAETGARAFNLMQAALNNSRFKGTMRKIPFLLPLTSQCTDMEPCRTIYEELPKLTNSLGGVGNVEFAAGFPPADIFECGATVIAYGEDSDQVNHIVDQLYQRIVGAESEFANRLYQPKEAIVRARSGIPGKPVVLADAQDNPGAGGTSDTTELLSALVDNQAQGSVLGVMFDPEIAVQAHELGTGSMFKASLGAKSGFAGSVPYQAEFLIEALADGNFIFTGDMYKNSPAQLGPMALLKIHDANSDVRVIVSSVRVQCLDLAIFRHLGVEPTKQKILAVKSSVHFRADFDPIASEILVVAAPGANFCEFENITYRNLRNGIKMGPCGPVR